jgi:DNA-binding IclR family transcriptional regulator
MLLCIAHDPGVRLRDIAARTGVTERTAYGIVTDLTEAGYVVKHEDRQEGAGFRPEEAMPWHQPP